MNEEKYILVWTRTEHSRTLFEVLPNLDALNTRLSNILLSSSGDPLVYKLHGDVEQVGFQVSAHIVPV